MDTASVSFTFGMFMPLYSDAVPCASLCVSIRLSKVHGCWFHSACYRPCPHLSDLLLDKGFSNDQPLVKLTFLSPLSFCVTTALLLVVVRGACGREGTWTH